MCGVTLALVSWNSLCKDTSQMVSKINLMNVLFA